MHSKLHLYKLLLLVPTGVVSFNIHALTIHSTLRIPIAKMHCLEGQSLSNLQERLYQIQYILIDEMSFIGPKLLTRIDDPLREAFPSQCTSPFGGCSIILPSYFGQFPLVKDTPMYVGLSRGNAFWHTFNTFVTLSTIFHQQGDIPSVSTGIKPKVVKGSFPGNKRTTFEERTGLLLFREGSLTKYQQCQICTNENMNWL